MKKATFCLSLLAASVAVHAQSQNTETNQDIERIVVSGDFRQTILDQLSASATVVDAERLQSRQPDHVDSLLSSIPNVNFAAGASRGRFVQIRGIGERSQFREPINPSVSFFVDDFDFSGLAASGLIFDMQQVEVFRGPQATLFGTGALAGAVKLTSNAVGDTDNNYVDLRLATQDTLRLEAATGGEINDAWGYRVALVHNQSDGFIENTYLDREDTNNIDESALKIAVAGQVGERSELALTYRWYDIDNGYDAFSLDNDGKTRSDEPGFDRHQTDALSLRSTTQTAGGDFVVIGTYASHDIGYAYDEDWTFTGFHPWGYTSFDSYFRDVETQTAEVRFVSNQNTALFDGRTDWTVGALYKSSEEQLLRQYTYADSDFASTYEPTTRAVYLDTTTQLTEQLSLLAGLRSENYGFDYSDNAGIARSTDTTMLGGKLALQYAVGKHFYYASVSRGYKGAGFNSDERVSEERRFFDEEYNWNYELGFKGSLLNDDMTVRAAVFYMDRQDTQISDFDVLRRDDGTADFIDIIDNADLGTNQGVELEMSWNATDTWTLDASLGYLDATFEGFTKADGSIVEEQDQAQAPKYTMNVFSELEVSENVLWRVDVDFKDSHRFSDGHDAISPATTLVNSELVWFAGDWRTTFWVKNAFDREYYTRGFGGFSNDPRDEYAFDEYYYQLGNGRQYGVSIRYQF
ncbi:TonB-dependent receptor [Alteromonas sp. KUL49]|uniref:TonB-dependent receptor n=1 Tax=Alteromonas sp. KUL49 TaxID=2480798 RepID=UPI00102EDD17|nr:TonB-dependent receptor [Alteromonas sp. KUL49]TAP41413.1 TonB-dependent receptor [Alteromonas sp. KUL49]GEA10486.1 TonB-dependent receptor [Alteromonas sp. KUL49]